MKFIVLTLVGLTTIASLSFTSLSSHLPLLGSTPTPTTKAEVVTLPASVAPAPVVTTTTSSLTPTSKTVEKHKVDKTRVLYLTEQVTFPLMTKLINQLKEMNAKSSDPIYLLIDSPGGSVLDGASLISEIEASKSPVYTVCTRLCASMAAQIHAYGAKRYSTDRAILMYHPASAGVQGQVPNMLSQLSTISQYIQRMVAHQVSRSKMNPDEFAKRVAYEFWVESEDAVNLGLTDGIINLNVPSYEPTNGAVSFGSAPEREDRRRNGVVDLEWTSPHPELWNRSAR